MEKRYRPNVAVIVTDGEGRVLLCERNDGIYSQVQTVQGGIDEGESPLQAATREIQEEIGITPDQFLITAELPGTFIYEWPEVYSGRAKYAQYSGQEQKYFLAEVAPDVVFDITTHAQEFANVYWGTPQELAEKCWEAKRPGITAALRGFGLLPEETS